MRNVPKGVPHVVVAAPNLSGGGADGMAQLHLALQRPVGHDASLQRERTSPDHAEFGYSPLGLCSLGVKLLIS
jgi:hypothetical protein